MTTVPPQSSVVMQPQNTVVMPTTPAVKKHMVILKALGIVEVVVGGICMLVGIILFASPNQPNWEYYRSITICEGLWCGVWIVVSGGLGVGVGRKPPSPCLINTLMAFSIVGSVFAAALFSMSVVFALLSAWSFPVIMMSLMAIASFTGLVTQIVSASYCCCSNPAGCCGQAYTVAGQQVMYTAPVGLQPGQAYIINPNASVVQQPVYFPPQPATNYANQPLPVQQPVYFPPQPATNYANQPLPVQQPVTNNQLVQMQQGLPSTTNAQKQQEATQGREFQAQARPPAYSEM